MPEVRHYDISGSELTDAFYDAFAEAVRSSKELPITRDQVLAVMETIDLIRQSAARADPSRRDHGDLSRDLTSLRRACSTSSVYPFAEASAVNTRSRAALKAGLPGKSVAMGW